MSNDALRSFKFGVEIETVGVERETLARAVSTAMSWSVLYEGGYYGKWTARMPDGRVWTFMRDASLSGVANAEVVTPILTYADVETLQAVIRALRAAGARTDSSCGVHVHVGREHDRHQRLAPVHELWPRPAHQQRAARGQQLHERGLLGHELGACGGGDDAL